MEREFVTFEGYDGSGKSTLIEAVRAAISPNGSRIVGRKAEPELMEISKLIERQDRRPQLEVEMLLRIGLELERHSIIETALRGNDVVVCDRGAISLSSWFEYLDIDPSPFMALMERIDKTYRRSVIFVCSADFDVCWERVLGRSDPSPKERLGVDANRRFFSMYQDKVARYVDAGFDVVPIDTFGTSVAQSTAEVLLAMKARGL